MPRPLRAIVGKKRLIQSLKTDDIREAQRLRWPVVAAMKEEIAQASGSDTPEARRDVLRQALEWREALRSARDPDEDALIRTLIQDQAESWKGAAATDDGHGDRPPMAPEAADWAQVALGITTPLDTFVDRWLAGAGYAARTKADCRTAVRGLEDWCKEAARPAVIEAVNDKLAAEYRDLGLVAKGVPVGTANKKLTLLRRYWAWMEAAGEVEGRNPWDRKSLRKPKQHLIGPDAANARERPFTDEEMKKLLGGATDQDMSDAMRIAALSGMRLEEIGQLKVSDCRAGTFSITKAKTEAGIRNVPIHADLEGIVARRSKGKAASSYVFPDFKDTGWDGNRTMALSKRFATYRRRVGVDDAREGARRSKVNFHSFRRWFATKCEMAGQPENVVARVMGHEKGLSITFGLYSQADLSKLMKRCVGAVKLPSAPRLSVSPPSAERP